MDLFQLWLFISLIKVSKVSPRVFAFLLILSKDIVVLSEELNAHKKISYHCMSPSLEFQIIHLSDLHCFHCLLDFPPVLLSNFPQSAKFELQHLQQELLCFLLQLRDCEGEVAIPLPLEWKHKQ